MGKGVSSLFSNAGDTVKGTGMTIGQLKEGGLDDAGLGELVKQQGMDVSPGLRAGRIGVRAGMGALNGFLQQQQQQGGASPGVSSPVSVQSAQLPSGYWDIFTKGISPVQKFGLPSQNTNAFYGR